MAFQTYQFTVNAANGSSFFFFPGFGNPGKGSINPSTFAEIRPGGRYGVAPPAGILRGVAVRVQSGGGWTISSGRVVVAQPRNPLSFYENPSGLMIYPSIVAETSRLLYDSGTVTTWTPSAPEGPLAMQEDFGANSQPFDSWLAVALEWAAAGSGTTLVDVTLHNEPA